MSFSLKSNNKISYKKVFYSYSITEKSNNFVNPIFMTFSSKLGFIQYTCSGLLYISNKYFFFTSKKLYLNFLTLMDKIIYGVTFGYYTEIIFMGLGYRFLQVKDTIFLKVGLSHYIKIKVPVGLYVFGFKKRLIIFGLSQALINSFAVSFRNFKKPDCYKGKGMQFLNESLILKEGKKDQ